MNQIVVQVIIATNCILAVFACGLMMIEYACMQKGSRTGTSVTSQRSRISGMMRSTARHITCDALTGVY